MPTNLANNTEYAPRADSRELATQRARFTEKTHSSTLKFSCAVFLYTKSHKLSHSSYSKTMRSSYIIKGIGQYHAHT